MGTAMMPMLCCKLCQTSWIRHGRVTVGSACFTANRLTQLKRLGSHTSIRVAALTH